MDSRKDEWEEGETLQPRQSLANRVVQYQKNLGLSTLMRTITSSGWKPWVGGIAW